ncbi:FHA domain-containing protein [Prosthecobacter sp.]|uniref:FHA domain-containing protein n=1 Tax=Prosthecobacter sp. TaxID=1965333 RepID=UPI002AB9AA2D|nr:FHA domain-containing protein [Prosthecobacter sp.]MDZ4403013.1 FHA domain-containing protein [Prosthecobacter sp.]
MAKLTFVLEDGQEIVVPLAERVTLGRAEDNDVVVDDDRISKRHAEVVLNADGSIQVFDSNSTAGTFVNGERVRSHTITHGDRLAFGPLTAVLDLEEHAANGNGAKSPPAPGKLVKGGKIGARKKGKGAGKDLAADRATALPAEEILARRQAEQQEAADMLEETKTRLQAEVDAVQKELRDWQERSEEERGVLEETKARLQTEIAAAQKEFGDWQQRAEKERNMHNSRVETLRSAEERLVPMKAAVEQAEAAHDEWLKAIKALSVQHDERIATLQRLAVQHDQKAADLQLLADDEATARRELETLATHRDQTLAHLQQVRTECARDETILDGLRGQLAELEERCQESRELAEARVDQVKGAEKKLDQLSQRRAQTEAHIKELSGTEERLVQALARCRESEATQAALTAAIAALVQEQQRSEALLKDLEFRIAALQEDHRQASAATGEALATRQHTEESLHRIQGELAACEKDLATRSAELAAETQHLDETKTRRAEIEQQCQDLAGTEQKLAGVRQQLAAAEKQLAEVRAAIKASESQIVCLKSSIKGLEGEEGAAKGRIEVLHAREKDLRAELSKLAASERSERARFEEVRQLAAEAEKEHATQEQQLTSNIEASRSDLADLVSKLTPLREWKEAMDQLYARLATLPQDSPEARELWHEIEKEKSGLLDLITTARTQARAGVPEASRSNARPAVPVKTDRPRTATGSVLLPGTAQETTLRSRLTHLRESVQREESRLEQLRLERTRHETHPRPSPAADAMMREQSRHLESKIRQEEERHHALLRNMEASQAEEEKRRERLADMERKLAEMRADITEAERQRSSLRQQADLAQTELKNYEAALDRVMKKTKE